MLAPYTGPFGGVPAWDKVVVADFKPALEAAMEQAWAEIEVITANKAAPTFENTIAAYEDSGRTLDRLYRYFYVWSGNMSSPEFQAVEAEMSPKLSAFGDRVTQNQALFNRIEAVYNSPEKAKLTPEQQLTTGVTPGLVRLSVGLENVEDLKADLAQALTAARKVSEAARA